MEDENLNKIGSAKKRNWKGQELRLDEEQTPANVPAGVAIDDEEEDSEGKNRSEDEDGSSSEEEGMHNQAGLLPNHASLLANADTSLLDRSFRSNRKKSRVWNCFERGEYNKVAHRFTATCKYCLKKFDGRIPKLKSHVMECPEVHPEEKALCLKESDTEDSDEEGVGGTGDIPLVLEGVPIPLTTPRTERSRRGRPASKLWDCFIRGTYSKSAHRFSAVCKYCQLALDGRKQKLKNHILVCAMIEPEVKEAFRHVSIDSGPTPKKIRLNDSSVKGSRTKSGKKGLGSASNDDHHAALIYSANNGSNDQSDHPSSFYGANNTNPNDYLIKFFIRYGIPLNAIKDDHLQNFMKSFFLQAANQSSSTPLSLFPSNKNDVVDLTSSTPLSLFPSNKNDVVDLITHNYNYLKQQEEMNLLKNENFLTVIFHHEQDDISKTFHYYTNLFIKQQQHHRLHYHSLQSNATSVLHAYNIHSFHLENKNEIHLFSDRWKHALQSNGKVIAVTCDTEENYKIATEWVASFENYHRVTVVRCFLHLLVEFAASLLGHPYAIPIISDAFFLTKNLRNLYISNQQAGNKGSKYDQLLEQIYLTVQPTTRNRFSSLLLMIESLVRSEGLITELKNHSRNALTMLSSTKFWTSLKTIYHLIKPFLDILYQLESRFMPSSSTSSSGNNNKTGGNNTNSSSNTIPYEQVEVEEEPLTLADTAAYWIYLTNQLELQLPNLPDDYRQYVINIYNNKTLYNHLISDIYKIALFLHPKYLKGLLCYQEIFFKSLLKYSCTFIQGYGYNEIECSKLISQMIAYRNTLNATDLPDSIDLKTYWQTVNQGKDFQTLQTLVSIVFEINPIIQGQSPMTSTLQLNGQLLSMNRFDNFVPELGTIVTSNNNGGSNGNASNSNALKNDISNTQFLTMLESIRIHEIFSSGKGVDGSSHDNDLSDFENIIVERYELTNALELVYRRDLPTLFKSTELGTSDAFIKSEGINYHHPIFSMQGRLKRETVDVSQLTVPASPSYNKLDTPNRKAETTAFDIDALIEMTYNS